MKDLVEIEIPFAGFYETHHDSRIDDAINCEFQVGDWRDQDDERSDEEITAIEEAIYMADVNWTEIQEEYVKHYVESFGDQFDLDLEFVEMTSPREYNFSTDRVFAKVPREQINKIRKEVESHKDWPGYIKERFTDRDGFWSNFPSDYKDEGWTKETLQEVQYETILKFWLDNIRADVSSEGWYMEEVWLTEDFELSNWDSVIKAVDIVEKYLKEHKDGVVQPS